MGAQLSKGGVAVEGKAAADPAAAKANGQVSKAARCARASAGSHMAPDAHWRHGCRGGGLAVAPSCQGSFIAVGGKHLKLNLA